MTSRPNDRWGRFLSQLRVQEKWKVERMILLSLRPFVAVIRLRSGERKKINSGEIGLSRKGVKNIKGDFRWIIHQSNQLVRTYKQHNKTFLSSFTLNQVSYGNTNTNSIWTCARVGFCFSIALLLSHILIVLSPPLLRGSNIYYLTLLYCSSGVSCRQRQTRYLLIPVGGEVINLF